MKNLNECEYLIIGSNTCKILQLKTEIIKCVLKCKYLRVIFSKQGTSKDEVQEKILKKRRTIGSIQFYGTKTLGNESKYVSINLLSKG